MDDCFFKLKLDICQLIKFFKKIKMKLFQNLLLVVLTSFLFSSCGNDSNANFTLKGKIKDFNRFLDFSDFGQKWPKWIKERIRRVNWISGFNHSYLKITSEPFWCLGCCFSSTSTAQYFRKESPHWLDAAASRLLSHAWPRMEK